MRIALEIDDSQDKKKRINALDHLNEELKDEELKDRFGAASSYKALRNEQIDHEFCKSPRARAQVLALLYYYFEGEQQSQVLDGLLEAIEEIPAQPCKTHSLIALAPYLSEQSARDVVKRAFETVKEILEDLQKRDQDLYSYLSREHEYVQELEGQLQTLPLSDLLDTTLSILRQAENILFSYDSWWRPNMIYGVPPQPIPELPQVLSDKEVTRSDQIDADSNIGEDRVPQTLVRYPNLDCPDKVILNQRFSFTVELLIDKPDDQEELLYGQIIVEDDGKELPKVEVALSHRGFDIENSNTQFIEVERDDDSEVRFVLTPRKLGKHTIKVRFYQNGKLIGKATRNILVSEQPVEVNVEQPDPSAGLELKPSKVPPQDLELYIAYSDSDKTLSFELHSVFEEVGYTRKKKGSKILKGSPLEKMQTIYKEMDKLAKIRPASEEDKVRLENRLASIGNNLWDELIPDKLKEEYWKFKSRVNSVLILSEEPWIPWEMLKPYRYNDQDEEENDLFWCQQFSISRWLSSDAGTADELTFKTSRSIAPANSNLPSAQAEVDFLEHLSSLYPDLLTKARFTDSAEVLDSLKYEDLSVFHFACHGAFDSKSPNDSAIKLSDGPLRPSDIHARFGGKRQRPLIFINACHGGRAEFSFTGLGGWAKRMVDSRAGAFIGAMWEVNDKLALQFAQTFYKAFLQDNETIAESFRIAREEIRKKAPYNSTWLAYTLYADPEGRVKRKTTTN